MADPENVRILVGDVLERLRELPDESVQCVVTSPPYWGLRDYGAGGQLGLEASPDTYVERLVDAFREVRRVLRDDGTCWLNLGDTYIGGRNGGIGASSVTSQRNQLAARQAWVAAGGKTHRTVAGLKPKDLVGIPWRAALALQADGWWLRSDVIWHKPSPMPESVRDRPSRAHEYLFLLTRSERYFYDADAVAEPSTWRRAGPVHNGQPRRERNRRTVWRLDEVDAPDVWTIAQEPYPHSHFATFPKALVRPCVLAGSRPGDVVLDPFAGSGTTGEVALDLGRVAWLVELNPDYMPLIEQRLRGLQYPLIAPGSDHG